jgi:hypothetical protein
VEVVEIPLTHQLQVAVEQARYLPAVPGTVAVEPVVVHRVHQEANQAVPDLVMDQAAAAVVIPAAAAAADSQALAAAVMVVQAP